MTGGGGTYGGGSQGSPFHGKTDGGASAAARDVTGRRRLAVAAGVLGYAWVAGSLRSFTLPATLAVGVPGVLGVLTAASSWPARRREARAPDRWVTVWAAWFVALMLWELAAFLLGGAPDHPTLSDLLDPALAWHAIRSLAFLGWLALGWECLQR